MQNLVAGVCLVSMLTLAACGSNAVNPANSANPAVELEPGVQTDVQDKGQGHVQHNNRDANTVSGPVCV